MTEIKPAPMKRTLVSGMGRLIGAEFLKLRKRSMTWVLLGILVFLIVLVNLLLLAISKVAVPPQGNAAVHSILGPQAAVPFALSLIANLGALLAIVLAASSMGNEYNWKTIRTALISSESRFKFLTAKLVSMSLMILIGMVVGIVVAIIMSFITNAIAGNSFDFSFLTGSYVWDQFLQFWRTFFVIVPFAALGFMMSIVGRSAMPGIATGIGVFFAESIITAFMRLAGGWIANVPDYLLAANVQAITSLNQLPGGFGMRVGGSNGAAAGNTAVSLPHAYITLGLYAVAFLILAFYLFRKRDVTG